MNKRHISPWDNSTNSKFLFPLSPYEDLLNYLEIDKDIFLQFWLSKLNCIDLLLSIPYVELDWVWSFYLPLITDINNYLALNNKPLVIGISGLPGSGKSTFGRSLEKLSNKLNIPLTVISLDDFYLPAASLDLAMKGNPWDVPRGIPGSHSIHEINESINTFIASGNIKVPQFDKSLRDGMGDRSGWINTSAKVLIIEGWFVGCQPLDYSFNLNNFQEESLSPPLTKSEIDYRHNIQNSLKDYLPIWNKFYRVWHLKADKFSNTSLWKVEQEQNMLIERGSSLQGQKLQSFVRMIHASIPQESLQSIKSDVKLVIDKFRNITYASKAN